MGNAAKKIIKEKVDFPEHLPVIPLNEEIEKKKRENRKLAEKLREEVDNREAIIITSDGTPKKASDLTQFEQEIEITRCAIDPIYFIKTYLTIFDQTQGDGGMIVPFKLFKFQEDLIRAYMTHKFNVANKYRQAGISTTTSAYIAWYVMFNEHRNVAIVADKLETARDEMMRDVVDFIDSCPDYLRCLPIYKDNQKHKHYDNDCQLRAFATSSLRGYTPTLLFWDETAWAERGDVFWTAAKPSLQTGGRAIFVSTPNGLDPVFYKHFEGARRKENNFHAIELWWYNDPRYTVYSEDYGVYEDGRQEGDFDLEWVKNKNRKDEVRIKDEHWSHEKRRQLIDDGWEATSSWFDSQVKDYNGDSKKLAQELLCSFLGSGDNFINEDYLKRIEETEIKTPIRQEYLDNEMWIWEDPIDDAQYIISVDVSAGHGDDYSTINILKAKEVVEEKEIIKKGVKKIEKHRRHITEQVAEYYNKVTPQTLGYITLEYARRYNNGHVVIDVTNGYGAITVEKLLEEGYENVHYSQMNHKPTRDRLNGYVRTGQKESTDGKLVTVDLIPGFFIGSNRSSVLIELQRSINMADIIIRSLRLLNELKTFITVSGNRLADHKRSFHDDSIMGLSIGLFVINQELHDFGQSISRTKKMLDSIIKVSGRENIRREDDYLKTRNPDFRVTRDNPYGANSWLFQGMKKR